MRTPALRPRTRASSTAASDPSSRIAKAARLAADAGLEVHAGHGLTFNTVAVLARMPEVVELNIGHFLIGEAIFGGLHGVEAIRRLHAQERSDGLLIVVEVDERRQMEVGQTIGIVGQERFFPFEIGLRSLQTLANVRGSAGIDERDFPSVDVAAQERNVVPAAGEDEVVRQAFAVVEEILLDDVGLHQIEPRLRQAAVLVGHQGSPDRIGDKS